MDHPFVIGLTGNIASGKSLVASILAELGAEVIDADQVARECMAPGSSAAAAAIARFGPGVLGSDGILDRRALGRLVFGDPAALADLENIVHPPTRQEILRRLRASAAPAVVIEAIKLLESPLISEVNAVWVVTAPRELRFERLVERGLPADEARQRVDAQSPEAAKVERADVIIRNEDSQEDLRRQVTQAWSRVIHSREVVHGS
ncbi:MAG TPA: dephospho-CoA kinase [Chloroflexota bacterium]